MDFSTTLNMFKNLRRITDRQFWVDCVLATAFIFALIFFGGGIFSAFEVLNPIGEAISDMDVTDIVFSKLRKDPDAHDEVDRQVEADAQQHGPRPQAARPEREAQREADGGGGVVIGDERPPHY